MEGLTESVISDYAGYRVQGKSSLWQRSSLTVRCTAEQYNEIRIIFRQRSSTEMDIVFPAAEQPGCALHSGAVQRDERNQDCIPAAEQPGCVLHSGAVQRDWLLS